ncbi:MAG: hypothetical protein JST93_30320 [Acidobacteria bacterium]|nr:hypothetical protein [Acidobacteriota bacterium]
MFPILVVVYFCVLAGDALLVSFAADDMMNLACYHGRTAWELALANLRFYSTFYRPLGGVFYSTLYSFAGLNPLPYRAAIFFLLLVNIRLCYRFFRLCSASLQQARFATVFSCYHGAMVVVYYFNSQIYDVLCATFYYLAFNAYLSAREKGGLSLSRLSAVCGLYILALNAKEIAVTLPVFLLVHEGIFHRFRHLRPVFATGALTSVYVLGKCLGPQSLTSMEAYHPRFSLDMFLAGHASYLQTMFYLPAGSVDQWDTILFWAVLLVYALARQNQLILFCWFWILLSSLPIVFIGRMGGPAMYVPLAGYAMLVTAVCADVLRRFPAIALRWQHAALILTTLAIGAYHYKEKHHYLPAIHSGQALTWRTIQQLNNAGLQLPKGARVLFLNDPFTDWDMVFITQLYYNDPSLHVDLARKMEPKPTAEQLRDYDAVLQFEAGRIVQAPTRTVTRGLDPRAWLEALEESMPAPPPL